MSANYGTTGSIRRKQEYIHGSEDGTSEAESRGGGDKKAGRRRRPAGGLENKKHGPVRGLYMGSISYFRVVVNRTIFFGFH